jgi:hypothetical protein
VVWWLVPLVGLGLGLGLGLDLVGIRVWVAVVLLVGEGVSRRFWEVATSGKRSGEGEVGEMRRLRLCE